MQKGNPQEKDQAKWTSKTSPRTTRPRPQEGRQADGEEGRTRQTGRRDRARQRIRVSLASRCRTRRIRSRMRRAGPEARRQGGENFQAWRPEAGPGRQEGFEASEGESRQGRFQEQAGRSDAAREQGRQARRARPSQIRWQKDGGAGDSKPGEGKGDGPESGRRGRQERPGPTQARRPADGNN